MIWLNCLISWSSSSGLALSQVLLVLARQGGLLDSLSCSSGKTMLVVEILVNLAEKAVQYQ